MGIEGGTPKRFLGEAQGSSGLRLLRGEDIDLVSRDIGVTAATLTQWRDTFLKAGEAGLKPHLAKESVEVGRLREKNRANRPWKTSCFGRKSPVWSRTALWRSGGRGSEPSHLDLHRKSLRRGARLSHLGPAAFHRILAPAAAEGAGLSSWTARILQRCRTGRRDQNRDSVPSVSRRRLPEDLGRLT